jgi:Copper type II ascorbate-dependent monooxygenase, C-terminal domain/Copper type II ascorbate-dependent monooxygenase, N-terminal domain
VIAYESIIKSPLVHHVITYSCPKDISSQFSTKAVQCVSSAGEKAPGRDICQVAWTVTSTGLRPRVLPSNMGKSMGKWLLLEVHYHNPQLLANVTDTSGVSITYTNNLRPIVVGVMALGQADLGQIVLPPGENSVTVASECTSQCTSKLFSTPITIISSMFHAHTLGRWATTQHIRDGVELPRIGQLDHYDFNFQNPTLVPGGGRLINAGDRLITTCGYDTVGQTSNVLGGLGSDHEMYY